MPNPYIPAPPITDTYDATVNGELKTNITSKLVFVESNPNGNPLYADYAPGAFAVTYDLSTIYIKQPNGSWAESA